MRIRIKRSFTNNGRQYEAGKVVIVKAEEGVKWCAHGLAFEEKSKDCSPETKQAKR